MSPINKQQNKNPQSSLISFKLTYKTDSLLNAMNVSSGIDRSLLKDKSLQETVVIKQLPDIPS